MKKLSLLTAVILMLLCLTTPSYAQGADNTGETMAEATPQIRSSAEKVGVQRMRDDLEDVFNTLNGENTDNAKISLAASSYTVSGTVSLPTEVTAESGDIIRVYAYKAVEIIGGIAQSEGSFVKSESIVLSAGQSSASYSMLLPEGEYNIAVRYLSGHKSISSQMLYYKSTGMTVNEYYADVVNINGSKTVNLSLKKAESYICGTIDLSANVPTEDTYIGISANTTDYSLQIYSYIYIPISAGTRTVNYKIGVNKTTVALYVDYNNAGGYYSSGTIGEYKDRTALDASSPVEYLNIKVSSENSSKKVDVKINLATALTCDSTILIAFADEDGEILSDIWCYESKGTSSINYDMNLPSNDTVYLYYKDITGFDGISDDFDESCRFYSAELGYTSNIAYASNVAEMTSITINEPTSRIVSGSLAAADGSKASYNYYVGAEFDDEIFYTRANTTSGTYSISIPTRMNGKEFRLFTASGEYGVMNSDSKKYDDSSYTLSGNMSGLNITVPAFRTVSGTVYLPSKAPADGVNVELEYNFSGYSNYMYFYLGTLTIPAGEESAQYSVSIPTVEYDESEEDYISEYISAYIGIFEKCNITSSADTEGVSENEDIYFLATCKISGTVSLPAGFVSDKNIVVRITASGYASYDYTYITIPAGETSAKYELSAAKDEELHYIRVIIDTDDTPLIETLYYDKDGKTVAEYTNLNIRVTEDMESINIMLLSAATIKHNVTFKNYDGTVLKTEQVNDGEYASYTGAEPTKPGDDMNVYVFIGWDNDIDAKITADTVFTAKYEKQAKYTVKLTRTSEGNYDYIVYSAAQKPINANMIAVSYDSYGNLKDVKILPISDTDYASGSITLNTETTGSVKAMLFDAECMLKPIALPYCE